MRSIATRLRQQLSYRNFRHAFAGASGVRGAIDLASIMVGVLVIGIIGGVIAATVFAVIPWSQDAAAKGSLDSVRTAESVAKVQEGKFLTKTELVTGVNGAKPLLQTSPKIAVGTDADGTCFISLAKSDSGNMFFGTSKGPQIEQLTESTPASATNWCLDINDLLDELSTLPVGGDDDGDDTGNAALSSLVLSMADTNWMDYSFATFATTGNTTADMTDTFYIDGPGASLNGTVYFPASDTTDWTPGLYTSDGLIAGTEGVSYQNLVTMNGKLYASGNNTIYSFDGTTLSTYSIGAQIRGNLAPLGGKLYFVGYEATNGSELWSFDGSTASMVAAVMPGTVATSTDYSDVTVAGGSVYFFGYTLATGKNYTLYAYDGTGSPVVTAALGTNSPGSSVPTVSGSSVFLKVGVGSLVKFTGTTFTTVYSAVDTTVYGEVVNDNGTLYFGVYDMNANFDQLWKYTSANGAVKVADLPDDIDNIWWDSVLGAKNGVVYLTLSSYTDGTSFWTYDGSNWSMPMDLVPGSDDSYCDALGQVGGTFVFSCEDSDYNEVVFSASGTAVTQYSLVLNRVLKPVGR